MIKYLHALEHTSKRTIQLSTNDHNAHKGSNDSSKGARLRSLLL